MCLDAFALFANANEEPNVERQKDMKPDLNSKFKGLSKNTPVTTQLVGNNLSQLAKDINETQRIIRYMMESGKFNPVNEKAPNITAHMASQKTRKAHFVFTTGGMNNQQMLVQPQQQHWQLQQQQRQKNTMPIAARSTIINNYEGEVISLIYVHHKNMSLTEWFSMI